MTFNDLVSFGLELFALGVYGWSPFAYLTSVQQFVKILVAASLVVLVVALWSKFAAPRADKRLKGRYLATMKAAVFYPAAVLLGLKTSVAFLVVLLLIISINLKIEFGTYHAN